MRTTDVNSFLVLVLSAILLLPSNADADQLGIGGLRLGMAINDVMNGSEGKCRIGGMMLKSIKCYDDITVNGIPLNVELHFDIEDNKLSAIKGKFNKSSFYKLTKILDINYKMYSNREYSLYLNPEIVVYATPAGRITLIYNETKTLSAIHIISDQWQLKYEEIQNNFHKQLDR